MAASQPEVGDRSASSNSLVGADIEVSPETHRRLPAVESNAGLMPALESVGDRSVPPVAGTARLLWTASRLGPSSALAFRYCNRAVFAFASNDFGELEC